MSTSYTRNGTTTYPDYDPDWQAALDYAADQRRYAPWHDDAEHTDYHPLRDQRHACSNPACSALTEALFCSEECRAQAEGPDHDDACEREEEITAAEPSRNDRGNSGVVATLKSHPLPEAPASANCFVTLRGRQVQLTLRDTDERRLLQRLAVVLDQFPVEPSAQASTPLAPSQPPVCQWHGAMKESTKVPGTYYCPNKMGDGSSYCRERWPAKGR